MRTLRIARALAGRSGNRWLLVILASFGGAACSDLATEPESSTVVEPPAAMSRMISGLLEAARDGCGYGSFPSGALVEICSPSNWNGGVVFYAHGYVEGGQPLAVPNDVVGGFEVAEIVRGLGFVYAATSYRDNGLVAADAAIDLEQLAGLVQGAHPALAAAPAYLLGVSEGALASALAIQNPSTRFDGALPLCGPVGSFRLQTYYLGDFRLIFDYFFPGVLPGDPFDPAALAALQPDWESIWEPAVRAAIAADLGAGGDGVHQLFAVTRSPFDPSDPGQTAVDLLRYNVFGSGDAAAKLGGLPFDNAARSYSGSYDDALLNSVIPRFTIQANAAELARYETTGRIERPTVTLHTRQDQIVPVWHELFYAIKAGGQGDLGQLIPVLTQRYGHCQFTVPEVLAAFALLAVRVQSEPLTVSRSLFLDGAQEAEFVRLTRAHGGTARVQ